MSKYVPSEDESQNETSSDENVQMDDPFEFVCENQKMNMKIEVFLMKTSKWGIPLNLSMEIQVV